MADRRVFGNPDKSPAEVGAQVRDKASAYYQQGRQQVEAVENTLEDAIRAKPLQSMFIAAGIGMFMGLLLKK
jgi:ElaB/YqjD/DUF883 family membrane-anchored ribosome-binding protein